MDSPNSLIAKVNGAGGWCGKKDLLFCLCRPAADLKRTHAVGGLEPCLDHLKALSLFLEAANSVLLGIAFAQQRTTTFPKAAFPSRHGHSYVI